MFEGCSKYSAVIPSSVTVIGSQGIPFEVQIRTWEMHRTAEYGIAAHWKYKIGDSGVKTGDEEKFAWVRRLLESQQESDATDFFHNLKIDMFADEVFVFSPKGDVINLPAGATPIDFAYSIHSAVGNSMVGASVNGRIVTFDHVLQNGDIVEVRTAKNAPGPSRDWLNIAKSGSARTKIKQWFKKERREENIARGKEMFMTEVNTTLGRCLMGCYSSQARIKKAHRALENKLYSAERICSHAAFEGRMEYPEKEMQGALEDLLLAQFHEFRLPPANSSHPVRAAVPRLSRGISQHA